MSTPPPGPQLNLRGAVDLSGLSRRPGAPGAPGGAPPAGATGRPAGPGAAAAGGQRAPGTSPFVVEVTDATFADVVQISATVPVVLDLRATWAEPSAALSPVLERLAVAADGAWLLGQVDVEASPQIAQAFQVQSVPTVVAVVKGQPVPLFAGAQTEDQVVRVIAALMDMAAQNGVTGRLDGGADGEDEQAPALPAYEVEALEALERGDTDAALAAYTAALAADPRDAAAVAGLSRVHLLVRVAAIDLAAVRAAAADDPDDVDAALAVADADVAGGHLADAFDRLVALLRRTGGDERDRVRERLLELFDVVGPDDPAVVAGRRAMTTALF